MASTARVLYEIEARFGPISEAPQIAVALFADYLLDGGDPGDEEAFQSHVDETNDLTAVTTRVEGLLRDPTDGETVAEATRSYGSPSLSPESGA